MSEGLSRDELIEKAKRLGQARGAEWFDQECRPDPSDVEWCVEHDRLQLLCVSDAASVAAMDAVLRAVADGLERESRQRVAGLHIGAGVTCTPCAESDGLRQAAERVRDLLGKDKTNE